MTNTHNWRYDVLLTVLCVDLGWCGSATDNVWRHVPEQGPVTADEFADLVMLAEGYDPQSGDTRIPEWRHEIRTAFIRQMGAEVVDASQLQLLQRSYEAAAAKFSEDDLSSEDVRELVRQHLAGMHENSPPESVHAFDIDKLRQPGVTFLVGRVNGKVAVMGALKQLDAENGEIKSMRVANAFRGTGLGGTMLAQILCWARAAKLKTVWLETGSTPAFDPALKLYEQFGFTTCGPFADYKPDPFSVFMTRAL